MAGGPGAGEGKNPHPGGKTLLQKNKGGKVASWQLAGKVESLERDCGDEAAFTPNNSKNFFLWRATVEVLVAPLLKLCAEPQTLQDCHVFCHQPSFSAFGFDYHRH